MASSRKPSDHFTRFTSATPHASSYQIPRSSPSFNSNPPAPNSTQPSSRSPRNAPPSSGILNETPAQKVARLRAAHRAAQEAASYSRVDRMIAAGRVVADHLHRGTAYTLMGFTAVAGALSIYSLVSLVFHHRRQRRAWIEHELQRLSDAQTAFLRGEATAEQLHLLEQERAGEELKNQWEVEKERKKANSLWARTKRSLYRLGGVEEEESLGEKARKGEFSGIMDMVREKEARKRQFGDTQQGQADSGLIETVEDYRRSGEQEITARTQGGKQGGMFDQMADNTVSAAKESSRSWLSWGRGGS